MLHKECSCIHIKSIFYYQSFNPLSGEPDTNNIHYQFTGDVNRINCEVNLANEVSRLLSLLQKPTENL
jgi:hypothetical protein